jgi:hypothetical protein
MAHDAGGRDASVELTVAVVAVEPRSLPALQ